MNQHHALADFAQLQTVVRTTYDVLYKDLGKKARSITFVTGLQFFIVAFGITIFGSIVFTPLLRILLSRTLPEPFGSIIAILSIPGWFLVTIIPCALVASYVSRLKFAAFLLFSVIVNPLLLSFAVYIGAHSVDTANTIDLAVNYLIAAVASSVIILVAVFAVMYVFSNMLPKTLLLALTSTPIPSGLTAIPSETKLLERVIADGLLVVQGPEWTISRLQRVQAIAQNRVDGSNAQGQAFSFILTALGLTSTVGLLLTQEQIRNVLSRVETALARFTDGTRSATGAGGFVIVVLMLLGGLVLFSLLFFTASYHTLRILEAVQILCATRIAELEDALAQPQAYASTPPLVVSTPAAPQSQLTQLMSAILFLLFVWRFIPPRRRR